MLNFFSYSYLFKLYILLCVICAFKIYFNYRIHLIVGEKEDITVRFYENSKSTFSVFSFAVKRSRNYRDQVREILLPEVSDRKNKSIDLSHYQLMNPDGAFIIDVPAKSFAYYDFALPQKIIPDCASNWNSTKLEQLGIEFEIARTLTDLLKPFAVSEEDSQLTPEAEKLITDLDAISFDMLVAFRNNNDYTDPNATLHALAQTDSLVKTMFMVFKFGNVEAIVDLFVAFLLERIGFYQGRLFTCPQFPHQIHFGTEQRIASPDFTIMDVLSFFRAVVIVEKSTDSSNVVAEEMDVEAQLIAGAIAIYQANESKMKQNSHVKKEPAFVDNTTILGIKVKGMEFTFYAISITSHIITAMKMCAHTHHKSCVSKFGPHTFLSTEGRRLIIHVLHIFKHITLTSSTVGNNINPAGWIRSPNRVT
jgi:hypothetical protein